MVGDDKGSAPPTNDSSARIQLLWQQMQNNRNVIIKNNCLEPKFQWNRWMDGDPTVGSYCFLDFMEIVNLTMNVVKEKDAGATVLEKIKKWLVRVRYENSKNKGKNPDITLITKGDDLWLEYEKVLFTCSLVAVKKTDVASK